MQSIAPKLYKIVVTHQAKKIWLYDRTTVWPYKVLLLTCVANCTTGMPMPWLCPVVQWLVHWAPSRTTWVLVLARTRHCALATCGKKMRAPLLGSAKSIYYYLFLIHKLLPYQENRIKSPYIKKWKLKQIQKDSLLGNSCLLLFKITFKSKWFWGSFYFPLLYAHCLKRKKSIYFFLSVWLVAIALSSGTSGEKSQRTARNIDNLL